MSVILHVAPSGMGGWRVERIGSGEAETFPTREAAEAHARSVSDADGDTKVLVHDERGAITEEWGGPAEK